MPGNVSPGPVVNQPHSSHMTSHVAGASNTKPEIDWPELAPRIHPSDLINNVKVPSVFWQRVYTIMRSFPDGKLTYCLGTYIGT